MRPSSNEGWKKGMMNIDESVRWKMTKEIGRKYLHIAGQHDEVDAKQLQHTDLFLFGLRFVFFRPMGA